MVFYREINIIVSYDISDSKRVEKEITKFPLSSTDQEKLKDIRELLYKNLKEYLGKPIIPNESDDRMAQAIINQTKDKR